jgi:hypothetical protein
MQFYFLDHLFLSIFLRLSPDSIMSLEVIDLLILGYEDLFFFLFNPLFFIFKVCGHMFSLDLKLLFKLFFLFLEGRSLFFVSF